MYDEKKDYNQEFNYFDEWKDSLYFFERFSIFRERPILILWVSIYFLFFWSLSDFSASGFWWTLFLYIITVSVALSDFVENIMRIIEDVRRVATNTEKERLFPLFDEVYEEVKKQSPHISDSVQLYIVDDVNVNAFALGNTTIVVTRGLMETMDDNEIKGILAHEFAHISNGDTLVRLLVTFGSTIFLWIFLVAKWLFRKIEKMTTNQDNKATFASMFIGFFRWLVEIIIMALTSVATIILMSDSRKKEFGADTYAYKIGYGGELIQALYKLYEMQMSYKRNVIEKMKSSHPRMAYRIEALEKMI